MSTESNNLRNVRDFEIVAMSKLSDDGRFYFSAAAGKNQSSRINEKAFERIKILPRVLRDVSSMDLSLTILGSKVSCPVGICPTAFQHLAHPAAELNTVKAALEAEIISIISCSSSTPFEEYSKRYPQAAKWMQLYIFNDRSVIKNLVEKAEACGGYSALVLTLDSPVAGLWIKAVPDSFLRNAMPLPNLPTRIRNLLDPSATFKDLLWVKSITKLPIVAKGIMTGQDAAFAIQHGASAILVSNHGGRNIEDVSSTVDVLEDVVAAVRKVNPKVEVYLDGGVRSGSDVFKALALGARAVFVGKPVLWGMNVAGKDGVRKVLDILKSELQTTMALSGARCLGDIAREMVRKDGCCCSCKL